MEIKNVYNIRTILVECRMLRLETLNSIDKCGTNKKFTNKKSKSRIKNKRDILTEMNETGLRWLSQS